MDKMVYLGMTGAKYAQLAQATTVNNLANASTPGFRGDFQSLMSSVVEGAGMATRVNSTLGAKGVDLRQGVIQSTGNPLDVAINGDGWIAVRAPDGSEAYTRRGDLHLTADGQLLNGAGQAVLGEGGPIAVPPHQSLSIGGDGSLSLVPLGQSASTLAVVERIKLVRLDPAKVVKGEDGLIRQRDGQPGQSGGVRLQSGALEGSNVSPVEAMVNLIGMARQFDWQMNVMKTAGQVSDSGNSLLRMG